MGDIAIWSNAMNGQGGHVAIVAQDNGNGTVRVLNANATSAGPRGNSVMSNLSTGSLLGYLRPRKLMK
jgi:surface antigen